LPDELIEPLAGDDTLTVGVDIHTVAVSRRVAVDRDLEPGGLTASGAEHQVQVPRMEPVDDAAVSAIERGAFLANRPVA